MQEKEDIYLYTYTYGRFMLRFDRKQQNSVKQLSFNKKKNVFKEKGDKYMCVCVYIYTRIYTHTQLWLIHVVI